VLEKVAMGVQNKFANGSAAVKTLVKVFTATSGLRSKHKKIAKGLVVGKGGGNKLLSNLILASLSPLNALGDKLVWSKVKDGFGGKNKVIISGGSALAGSLETFYEDCGLTVCVGYGLTECRHSFLIVEVMSILSLAVVLVNHVLILSSEWSTLKLNPMIFRVKEKLYQMVKLVSLLPEVLR